MNYKFIGYYKLNLIKDKTTISGISCLFKTYYAKNIQNLMKADYSKIIKFTKNDRFCGKELTINNIYDRIKI